MRGSSPLGYSVRHPSSSARRAGTSGTPKKSKKAKKSKKKRFENVDYSKQYTTKRRRTLFKRR